MLTNDNISMIIAADIATMIKRTAIRISRYYSKSKQKSISRLPAFKEKFLTSTQQKNRVESPGYEVDAQ